MKTLDDAVVELGGVLNDNHEHMWRDMSGNRVFELRNGEFAKFTGVIFEQRAKELGFINGYRWGVKYKTNGNKPDLSGDLSIEWFGDGEWEKSKIDHLNWSIDNPDLTIIESFRIIDQRYKPIDTSYLDKPDSSLDNEAELSIAIADAMNAAVSYGQVEIAKRLQEINKDVLAEANKRKAEAEKKRVVDAAYADLVKAGCVLSHLNSLYELYDLGYLRLPANKD
jgi:hypothetical protein